MLRERRVKRYQRFLKILRHPIPSQHCSCPAHIHPRPWVPPPCRTTKAYGKSERACAWREMEEEQKSQSSIQHLYNEARILKEAVNKIRQGDRLSKDAYNTVKKWSKERLPEAEVILERNRQRREQSQGDELSKTAREEPSRGGKHNHATRREEEDLRAELRNLRELSQSNEALLHENKKLMTKVHKLQQRIKRQEVAGKGSRETMVGPEPGGREEYILLSLRKKYDDLLQYVLKVEAENQKLKSLGGVSGRGQEDWLHNSEREDAGDGHSASLAPLHSQIQTLKAELQKKDEYIVKCDQHLLTLKENMALQDSLKGHQSPGQGMTIDPATLEEEWTRRLIQTKEIYDQAIYGYKDQLDQLQTQMESSDRDHKTQIQKLTERLARGQVRNGTEEVGSKEEGENGNERQRNEGKTRLSKEKESESGDDSMGEGTTKHEILSQKSRINLDESDSQASNDRENGISKEEKSNDINSRAGLVMEGAKYKEALDLIVERLENLQVHGNEVETTLTVIKDTISTCLQEWRESFHHEQTQAKSVVEQMKTENEELHKKLHGMSKKVESLQHKCLELEQENIKLHHQISSADSRVVAAVQTSQLDELQRLPQKLQEAEQALIANRELLHKAQAEKQTLQDQACQLSEKLAKKEAKLKVEREQSTGQREILASLNEAVATLRQQAEERERDSGLLREQLAIKDSLLEQTSAQLEERIRECARLTSQLERYKFRQDQDADHFQARLQDHDSTSHKQFLDAQAQASRYQAQLSAMRSEKEHIEKSLRCHIRKLEEQVDQLQLRNSTLERQLSTITSTFHSMFVTVDLNLPTSPNLPGVADL